jgi:hypothetical protein
MSFRQIIIKSVLLLDLMRISDLLFFLVKKVSKLEDLTLTSTHFKLKYNSDENHNNLKISQI